MWDLWKQVVWRRGCRLYQKAWGLRQISAERRQALPERTPS